MRIDVTRLNIEQESENARTRIIEAIVHGDAANVARDWAAAESAYAVALKYDPTLAHVWVQYGHSLKEQGYLERAEDAYRRAIALGPELADSHLQLGHALKLLGRRADAGEAYARALALSPDFSEAKRELTALK